MIETFLKALSITLTLALFSVPGYMLGKFSTKSKSQVGLLSNILLYVCQPAIIVNSFCIFSDDELIYISALNKLSITANFVFVAITATISMIAVAAICKILFGKSHDPNTYGVLTFASVFSNCGFMGIPFIRMFCGNSVLSTLYSAVYCVVFSVLCWTLGIIVLGGGVKNISWKKVLLNPTVIATVYSVTAFFVPQLNLFAYDAISDLRIIPQYIANASVPLSMILIGILFADLPKKNIFSTGNAYLSGAMKLIASPVIALAVSSSATLLLKGLFATNLSDKYAIFVPVAMSAMAPASLVVAMAEKYTDCGEFATAVFYNNSMLSVITIPIIVCALDRIVLYL